MTGEFKISDDDLAKAGVKPVDLNEAARVALQGLSSKIERAKAEAFATGLDFAHGPVENERDDPSFTPPPQWVVYRNPDYDGPEEEIDK